MLLTIAIVGATVLLVTVGIAAAAHDPHSSREVRAEAPRVLDQTGPSRFFVDAPVRATEGEVPVALLLARLEQHIRYEEAAVEAFLHAPERETLYSETSSNWVN